MIAVEQQIVVRTTRDPLRTNWMEITRKEGKRLVGERSDTTIRVLELLENDECSWHKTYEKAVGIYRRLISCDCPRTHKKKRIHTNTLFTDRRKKRDNTTFILHRAIQSDQQAGQQVTQHSSFFFFWCCVSSTCRICMDQWPCTCINYLKRRRVPFFFLLVAYMWGSCVHDCIGFEKERCVFCHCVWFACPLFLSCCSTSSAQRQTRKKIKKNKIVFSLFCNTSHVVLKRKNTSRHSILSSLCLLTLSSPYRPLSQSSGVSSPPQCQHLQLNNARLVIIFKGVQPVGCWLEHNYRLVQISREERRAVLIAFSMWIQPIGYPMVKGPRPSRPWAVPATI